MWRFESAGFVYFLPKDFYKNLFFLNFIVKLQVKCTSNLRVKVLKSKRWRDHRIARELGILYLPIGENRRLKKVHVLLVTLSHSRKGYVLNLAFLSRIICQIIKILYCFSTIRCIAVKKCTYSIS